MSWLVDYLLLRHVKHIRVAIGLLSSRGQASRVHHSLRLAVLHRHSRPLVAARMLSVAAVAADSLASSSMSERRAGVWADTIRLLLKVIVDVCGCVSLAYLYHKLGDTSLYSAPARVRPTLPVISRLWSAALGGMDFAYSVFAHKKDSFFADGWGVIAPSPEAIQAVTRGISPAAQVQIDCHEAVAPFPEPTSVDMEWLGPWRWKGQQQQQEQSSQSQSVQTLAYDIPAGVAVREARFESPLWMGPMELVRPLPAESRHAHVLFVVPLELVQHNPSAMAVFSRLPMCLHMAATGDEGFNWRLNTMAAPLCRGEAVWQSRNSSIAQIGSALLEIPHYGVRRPPHQQGVDIRSVAEMFGMTKAAIEEGRAVLQWLHDQSCPTLGVTGISQGGYVAACVGSVVPFPVAISSNIASHSGAPIFTEGVLSRGVSFDKLTDEAHRHMGAVAETPRSSALQGCICNAGSGGGQQWNCFRHVVLQYMRSVAPQVKMDFSTPERARLSLRAFMNTLSLFDMTRRIRQGWYVCTVPPRISYVQTSGWSDAFVGRDSSLQLFDSFAYPHQIADEDADAEAVAEKETATAAAAAAARMVGVGVGSVGTPRGGPHGSRTPRTSADTTAAVATTTTTTANTSATAVSATSPQQLHAQATACGPERARLHWLAGGHVSCFVLGQNAFRDGIAESFHLLTTGGVGSGSGDTGNSGVNL